MSIIRSRRNPVPNGHGQSRASSLLFGYTIVILPFAVRKTTITICIVFLMPFTPVGPPGVMLATESRTFHAPTLAHSDPDRRTLCTAWMYGSSITPASRNVL